MITVFTATYNREYLIGQLYQSLLSQTSYDFEWLIVDDGSTDSTDELIRQWKNNLNPFPIQYIQQKNGGKHRAINRGVQEAKGDAFFIVDSDDYLIDNAIQLIEDWWKNIASDSSLAGVSGLKANKDMSVVGDAVVFDGYVDATNLERPRYGLNGDKAEVYKTAILRKYPFPEFEGEKFLTEAVVWDKIAYDGYKIRWYNQIIYICEYREDGLTHQGMNIFFQNPKGWWLYMRQSSLFSGKSDGRDYPAKLNYYEWLHIRLTDGEFMDILCVNREELEFIKRYIKNTIESIGKNIAVYGLGQRGQKLLRLYRETPITVKYVLDKNKKNNDYAQAGLDDELPEVDAIIVTPKYYQDEIMEKLKAKTKNRLLRYEEWEKLVWK